MRGDGGESKECGTGVLISTLAAATRAAFVMLALIAFSLFLHCMNGKHMSIIVTTLPSSIAFQAKIKIIFRTSATI